MIAHGLTARRMPPSALARAVLRSPPPRHDRPRHSPGAAMTSELDVGEQGLEAARQRLAGLVWPPRVLRQEQGRVWGESEPAGAGDGVLVFVVGFALGLGGARYLPVACRRWSSWRARCSPSRSASAIVLKACAGGDRGAGGLGDATGGLLDRR